MTSSTIGMSHELANTLNVQAALDELVKILIASIATPRWYRPQCPLPREGNVCLNVRLRGALRKSFPSDPGPLTDWQL